MDFLRQFEKKVFDSLYQRAIQEFVKQEVTFRGFFLNDYLQKDQGHPGTILVGKWKYHADEGLYVRCDMESPGVSLAQSHSFGRSLAWNYVWRRDIEQQGFLNLQDQLSLAEILKVHQIAEKFTDSLNGYLKVVTARS